MSDQNKLPKIKQSGVINIHGKGIATYEATLDYAHQCGIQKLVVEMVQFPLESNNNSAICSATLETKDGKIFKDIGDANPDNVPRGCVASYIRIASSRAKARVMSDAFNVKSHLDDRYRRVEIGNENDVTDVDFIVVGQSQQSTQKQVLNGGGSKPLSEKQEGLIHSLAERKDVDVQSRAMQMFGKNVHELQGIEASELIQSLK